VKEFVADIDGAALADVDNDDLAGMGIKKEENQSKLAQVDSQAVCRVATKDDGAVSTRQQQERSVHNCNRFQQNLVASKINNQKSLKRTKKTPRCNQQK
jgi:hypothetical protein